MQPPHPTRHSQTRFFGHSELVVDSNVRIIIQLDRMIHRLRLLQLGQPQLDCWARETFHSANVPFALASDLHATLEARSVKHVAAFQSFNRFSVQRGETKHAIIAVC